MELSTLRKGKMEAKMEESRPELSPNHKNKNIKDIVLKTGLWYNIIRNQVRRRGEYMLMECKTYLGGEVWVRADAKTCTVVSNRKGGTLIFGGRKYKLPVGEFCVEI